MTQEPATIRPLTGNDLDAVIAIDRATTGTSRRGYFEKRLSAATERPRDYVYVGLETGGQLAGFAFAKLVSGEFGKPGASASLDSIGVSPEHAHKGFGRQLLRETEKILANKGVTTLATQVGWPDPAMLGFFANAGFELAPRIVLARSTAEIPARLPEDDDEVWDDEPDYSSPEGDAPDALSRDRIPVRSMTEADLRRIVAIDRANTGTDRSEYYARKQHESLHQTGVRVSLVAELDGYPVGFIMARVDFGEFGHTSPEAEMDTLGVDPGYRGQGVGRALMAQLVASLAILQVESVRTEIDWNDTALGAYLDACGFTPSQRIPLLRHLT